MARFTSILDRLGGGNSNVVSRLVKGRRLPQGNGLRMVTNPVEVVEVVSPVDHRSSKHKKDIKKDEGIKKGPKKSHKKRVTKEKSEEYNPRYTSWFKKAKKINIEGEGIHFNKKE